MTSISTANAFAYRNPVSFETTKTAGSPPRTGGPHEPNLSLAAAKPDPLAGSAAPTQKESSLRQALDAGYKALGKIPSGEVTGAEWDKVVGFEKFSRAELFSMTQNATGEFSKLEMDVAKMVLADRHAAASRAASPDGSDHAAIFRASVAYLDEAGPDEMKTLDWAKSRAAAQAGYEGSMQDKGLTPENLDSGNGIVELFLQAYREHQRSGRPDLDVSDMPSYRSATDLWTIRQQTSSAYFIDME